MHDTVGWEWEAEWSANRSFMVWENRAQVFPVGADKLCPAHLLEHMQRKRLRVGQRPSHVGQ